MIEHMFDSDEWVPENVDALEPGPVLAAWLSSVDVAGLSGADRVRVLRARARLVAHVEALVLADTVAVLDAVADLDGVEDDEVFRAAAAEVATALHLTRRSAESQLEFAVSLRRRLPQVWEVLAAGDIDVRRAKVIEHGTAHLDAVGARRVADQVLGEAPTLTTGQLRVRLRRLCIETDPEDAQDRYETAVTDRRVVVEPTVDGTANLLGLDLPPDRVAAISARIDHLAKSLRTSAESRTMDQLRADVLLDLLDGTRNATGGIVEVRVDLATLAGLENHPGEVGGYGPVIAEIAGKLTDRYQGGSWRYVVTDPTSGMPVDVGVVRRRPTARQRRAVEATHRTCVFPGCRMPASACDLDHTTPWVHKHLTWIGGLAPLCRHHHILKDGIGWTYRPLADGDYLWTSLLGHTYTTSGQSP